MAKHPVRAGGVSSSPISTGAAFMLVARSACISSNRLCRLKIQASPKMRDRLAELAQTRDQVSTSMANTHQSGFFNKINQVRQRLVQMSAQVHELGRKHHEVLSVPLPDQRVKKELEQLNRSIKHNSASVQAELKSMKLNMSRDRSRNAASVDQRIQNNQHSDLVRQFVDVMTTYNATQLSFREKSKARIQRQLQITGRETTDQELEEILTSDLPVFTYAVSHSQVSPEALKEIESRHRDIVHLESSIRDLHQLFADISMLVNTQGELVNNIESNVASAGEYVQVSKKELTKAAVYKKKSQKRCVIIVSVAVALLAVIALVLGLSLGLR